MCSDHFFGRPAKLYDVDKPDWVPSLNLGYNCCHSANISMERYKRISERNNRKRSRDGEAMDGANISVVESYLAGDNEGNTAVSIAEN